MPAKASLTVLIVILSLGLAIAASEDPFRKFAHPSRGRRHLVDTCPEDYKSAEEGYTRGKIEDPSLNNQCSVYYSSSWMFEVGPKSGDFYFKGYCNVPGKYFAARFGIRFYNNIWAKAGGNEPRRLFVNTQETKVYRLETVSGRWSLYEHDAENGDITKGYNITDSFSYDWRRFGMAFDDSNGAALIMAEYGNLNQNNGCIYKFDVTSGQLKKYNNLPIYDVNHTSFSYFAQKTIINHHYDPNYYLSLLNLTQDPPNLERIYAYNIPNFYPSSYYYSRPDPSNPSTLFNVRDLYALYEYSVILILARIPLLQLSESQIKISKYTYSNSEQNNHFLDFNVMNNSIYFLFRRYCSSCNPQSSSILFVMENVTEGSLPSIDQCILNAQQGNCRKAFITTNQFYSTAYYVGRIDLSNKMIILHCFHEFFVRTDLDSITEGPDFEAVDNLSSYFPDLSSASFASVTHTGSIINTESSSVSSLPGLVTTNEAEVELDYENSYINSEINSLADLFIPKDLPIKIEFTKGKVETIDVDPGCFKYEVLNLKYSLVNPSVLRLSSFFQMNQQNGSVSVNATDSEVYSQNYTDEMKIESSSINGSINIQLEFYGIDPQNEESDFAGVVGPVLAASFVGISVVVGSISLVTPNSGPGGLWMIINQQQLLVLLMLIGSHIHYDVKFFITKTKYVTFSFKELHLRSLDFTTICNQFDKMERNQTCDGLEYLGYGSMSAAQSNIEIPIAFILISILQLICIITCMIIRKVDWDKYRKRPESTQNTENNNNDCPEEVFDGREENMDYNENIEEQNEIPLSFWRKLWNRIKKWADNYLPIRFFTNVYIRICLEIFFIIAATTLNELINPGFNNAGQTISFVFSLLLLFLCLAFIVFLSWYFYKHYNTDLTHENNERPKIYFGELFLDLRPGIGRIDNAMIILRKFIYLCIIFCPGLSPPAIFSMLIILQVGYLVQTILFRKMRSLLLHIASIVNESFMILFMILFAVWRREHHWTDDGGFDKKLFIIYLILLNTSGVILLQLISLVDLIKSCKTKNRQNENESASTGNALQSEESKSSDQNPTSQTERPLAQIEQSNLPEIELSQSQPIDYEDIELDSCEERIPVASPEEEKIPEIPESCED